MADESEVTLGNMQEIKESKIWRIWKREANQMPCLGREITAREDAPMREDLLELLSFSHQLLACSRLVFTNTGAKPTLSRFKSTG